MSPTIIARLVPLATAPQNIIISCMLTGIVLAYPNTTIPALSPTSKMSMSALSHILAVEYSYAVRTEIFSFPFLDNISLTLSFVLLPCNYWSSPFMILSDSWRFLLLLKLSVIFFNDRVPPLSLRAACTNAGIALTTLSTIVIFAALDVLDNGLRSIVMTFLFIFI